MKKTPSLLKNVERVQRAIDEARVFAQEKGVSMTVERLAVCLGVPSRVILDFAMAEEAGRGFQKSHALLRMACEEIAASHIEHGMTKGNNPSMDILLLKNNLRYSDKAVPPAGNGVTVVLFGEDSLPE